MDTSKIKSFTSEVVYVMSHLSSIRKERNFVKNVLRCTKEMFPEEKPISDKVIQIKSRMFGCSTNPIVDIVQETLIACDTDIKVEVEKTSDLTYVRGALVVAITNDNSHNYGTLPAMVMYDKSLNGLLRKSGGWGNSMTQHIRPATDEEITLFVDEVFKNSALLCLPTSELALKSKSNAKEAKDDSTVEVAAEKKAAKKRVKKKTE